MAGGVLKFLLALGLLGIITMVLYSLRAWAGVVITYMFNASLGGDPYSFMNGQAGTVLNFFDDVILFAPVLGIILLVLAVGIEMYRKSTEGQQYVVGG